MMLQPLDSYLLSRRKLGRSAFRAQLTSPMLAVFPPGGSGAAGFKTETACTDIAKQAGELAQGSDELGRDARGAYATPVLKTANSPWGDRISVGRATNSDICIPDGSLSKLHAHLIATADGAYELTDVGSKNGTRVNGRLVEAKVPHRVEIGDTVQFGAVVAVVHSPASFFHFVLVIDAAASRSRPRPPSATAAHG